MRATWYVLEDGNVADPSEVSPDKTGKLVHKGGIAVAMRGEVPHSRNVDLDDLPAKKPAATKIKEATSPNNREMKAEGGKSYKTR